jgi:hypothetical protein
MTLVEVLVALSVLLIGIWGVAKGFPLLLRTVRDEARRTQMSTLAAGLAANLAADSAGLPGLIYGGNGTISPLSVPADPDSYSTTDNPANARDDLIHVTGERAVVPAVAAGGTEALYALELGRGNVLEATATAPATPTPPVVNEVVVLTPLATPQNYQPTGQDLPYGTYSVTDGGAVTASRFVDQAHATANLTVTSLELSYAWRDTAGLIHYVQRERIPMTYATSSAPATGNVAAQALTSGTPHFESVVENSTYASALIAFNFAGVGASVVLTPAGNVAMDSTGGLLRFNPADSGKTLLVDYDLDTEDATYHRLVREVWEDQVLSATDVQPDTSAANLTYLTVQLTATGLASSDSYGADDPLHLPLLPSANSPVETHVLALDLQTGTPYYETAGIDTTTQCPTPIDWNHGRVTLHIPTTALRHTFRIFYRTTDQAMLTVLKPAERFLPADTFATSPPAPTYATDTFASSGNTYTVLNFLSSGTAATPISSAAGMMVSVDYTYTVAGSPLPTEVVGELHTIPVASSQVNGNNGFYITLNHPGVQSVVAVRAASVRVRAWWRSESGRLETADIDTFIPPTPAPQ